MKHFMVDLETLDTGSDALVLSVGIVAFDPNTGETGAEFYIELNSENCMGEQEFCDRTISTATKKWWSEQSPEARMLFHEGFGNRVNYLHDGLRDISNFVWGVSGKDTDNVKMWGNGAAFDNVILRNLYAAADMNPPWKFYNDRCFRTLKNLPGAKDLAPNFKGTPHYALDDAMQQTLHLLEIYKRCLAPSQ
jgi:exodeoxyribonuclease VIII